MNTAAVLSGRRRAQKKSVTRVPKPITAAEFDAKFDRGEDMSAYIDWEFARRPGREVQRVNVDFPVDLLRAIDREAQRVGISRQAFIKLRIADAIAHVADTSSAGRGARRDSPRRTR